MSQSFSKVNVTAIKIIADQNNTVSVLYASGSQLHCVALSDETSHKIIKPFPATTNIHGIVSVKGGLSPLSRKINLFIYGHNKGCFVQNFNGEELNILFGVELAQDKWVLGAKNLSRSTFL